MTKSEKNRQFILEFYKAINGTVKTKELLAHFTSDPKLIEHLLFLENLFPRFKLIPEELTTEQDRVTVRANLTGKYAGEVNGLLPTQKTINTIFAAGYKIEHKKIIEHWFITDHMELIKQLGMVANAAAPAVDLNRKLRLERFIWFMLFMIS